MQNEDQNPSQPAEKNISGQPPLWTGRDSVAAPFVRLIEDYGWSHSVRSPEEEAAQSFPGMARCRSFEIRSRGQLALCSRVAAKKVLLLAEGEVYCGETISICKPQEH